jgi:hypothetical protein
MRPGSVPTAAIAEKLDMLIRDRWPHGNGATVLAEKVGCDESTIRLVIEQRNPGVSFDFADALFCALGRPMEDVGLGDIYWNIGFVETCASPACQKTFPEYHRGGKPKRTCSEKCKTMVEAIKLGRVGDGAGMRVLGRCNRGHRLTPENTKISKGSGFRRCRQCARERDRIAARERRLAAKAAA